MSRRTLAVSLCVLALLPGNAARARSIAVAPPAEQVLSDAGLALDAVPPAALLGSVEGSQ